MTSPDVYAVIYGNGRAETVKDGMDYWSILDSVYVAYQSAGGNWNRPVMLLRNGKVVVEKGLADLAWNYGREKSDMAQKTYAACKNKHKPEWLEDAQ